MTTLRDFCTMVLDRVRTMEGTDGKPRPFNGYIRIMVGTSARSATSAGQRDLRTDETVEDLEAWIGRNTAAYLTEPCCRLELCDRDRKNAVLEAVDLETTPEERRVASVADAADRGSAVAVLGMVVDHLLRDNAGQRATIVALAGQNVEGAALIGEFKGRMEGLLELRKHEGKEEIRKAVADVARSVGPFLPAMVDSWINGGAEGLEGLEIRQRRDALLKMFEGSATKLALLWKAHPEIMEASTRDSLVSLAQPMVLKLARTADPTERAAWLAFGQELVAACAPAADATG